MNKEQISKLNSFRLIVHEAEKHSKNVALIPKFYAGMSRLKEIVTELELLRVLQEQDITGITEDKNQTKEELIAMLADVSGALQSYAIDKKNNELFEKIYFSESTIDSFREAKISMVGTIIISEAEKLASEDLSEEGITPEEMASLKKMHDDYKLMLQAPRKAIIERSNNTEKISTLIEEGWDIKRDRLDKLISQFKRKDPDFFIKYQSASHIIYRRNNRNGNEENSIEETKAEG